MSANLPELVKELKSLNARKKRGEALSPEEAARRKELKVYLKDVLQNQKSGAPAPANTAEGSAIQSAMNSTPSVASEPPQPAAPKPFVPKKNAYALDAGGLLDVAAKSMEGAPVEDEKFAAIEVDDPELNVEPEPAPAKPAGGPKPYVPDPNRFMIDAGGILDAAAESKAVDKAQASASSIRVADLDIEPAEFRFANQNDINDSMARAESAARANKAERVTEFGQVAEHVGKVESSYTPPEADIYAEQYYDDYYGEGLELVSDPYQVELKPIDPREAELHALGDLITTQQIPRGLAFLDDFAVLYRTGILPPPDEEVEADSDDPNLLIPGKRKVTVHLLNGQVKRGVVRKLMRGEMGFTLEPAGPGKAEEISILHIKALFVHMKREPRHTGREVTVTFRDRRRIKGSTDDYQPGIQVFSLIPPTKYERIVVNGAAVLQVA